MSKQDEMMKKKQEMMKKKGMKPGSGMMENVKTC